MRTPRRSRPTSLYRCSPLVAALAATLAAPAAYAGCSPGNVGTPYCVVNANSGGVGSFLAAVNHANNNCSTNQSPTIEFEIPGTGPFTISVPSGLSFICFSPPGPFTPTIDGSTQAGFIGNSSPTGFNGNFSITLSGGGATTSGLQASSFFYGGSLTVKGVEMANFNYGGCVSFQPAALNGSVNVHGSRFTNNCSAINADGIYNGAGTVSSLIGGPGLGDRNFFGGNTIDSIQVCCENGTVTIENNFIGTTDGVTGGGGGKGVNLQTASNVTIRDNLISGNGGAAGIYINSSSSSVNISGNKIGTQAGGTALPNAGAGIHNDGGSPVNITSNTIAFNGLDGFVLLSGNGSQLTGNLIFGNGGKAINLGGVPTQVPNDFNDADSGANDLQNFPVIDSVIKDPAGNSTTINWTLNSTTGTGYVVEFFSNPSPTAVPQASSYLTTVPASIGAGNFTSGSTPLAGLHDFITATATNTSNQSTSELGAMAVAKGLDVSPSSHNFGSVVVGSTSGTVSATLTSLGAGPVNISLMHGGVSTCYGGPPPPPTICSGSQFNCSTTCVVPQAYSGGAQCSVSASFAPIALGPVTTTIYICDDAGGTPRTITLTGTGVAPPPTTASPPSHDFGSVVVGASSPLQSFTINNPSPLPVTLTPFSATPPFQIVTNTCGPTLAAATSCAIAVEYAPSALGASSGSLSSTSSAGGVSASLAGTGIAPPPATIAPPSHNFGAVEVGGFSANQAFTVHNPGPLSITLTPFATTGPFQIVANSCGATLAAMTSCSVTAKYAPVAVGAASGALATSASPGGASASLSGTGTAGPPPSFTPLSVDFGTVQVGTSSATTPFTLSNPSLTSIAVGPINVAPPFHLFSTTCLSSLPAQSACTADVKFSPTAVGAASGAVTVTAGGINFASGLTGTGTALPLLQIAPPSFDFGTILVGNSSANKTFSITNPSAVSTSLTPPAANAPFEVVSTTCGASLGGNASCDAVVRFTPAVHGGASGFLVANSSAGPSSATLSGVGLREPALSMSTSPIEFGSMIVGSAAVEQTITLNSTGNAILGINGISVSPPFTLSNGCGVSLAPGDSCSLTVGFNPTAIGDFAGFLGVSTNAPSASFLQVPVHAAVQRRPEPIVKVTPRAINFGARFAGSPAATQNVTISNEGGSNANLTLALNMPHFAIVSTSCGPTLAPQVSCNVELGFVPSGFGPRRATLVVSSNSPDSPVTVDVSGAGCRPVTFSQSRGGGSINCSP